MYISPHDPAFIYWRDAFIYWQDAFIYWQDAFIYWQDAFIYWRDAFVYWGAQMKRRNKCSPSGLTCTTFISSETNY